jgi:transposase
MRQRDELLALSARVAASRCLAKDPQDAVVQATREQQDRLSSGRDRQCLRARHLGGSKTGPNPTDRRKKGTKHHVINEAQGIPLAVHVTEANRHDVTELLPLVDAIPAIGGKRGRPQRRPDALLGDAGYDSRRHRAELRTRLIKPLIRERGTGHGSSLGKKRWVVERTLSWLHQNRRLRVRYEKCADIHEAFLILGCIMICWSALVSWAPLC